MRFSTSLRSLFDYSSLIETLSFSNFNSSSFNGWRFRFYFVVYKIDLSRSSLSAYLVYSKAFFKSVLAEIVLYNSRTRLLFPQASSAFICMFLCALSSEVLIVVLMSLKYLVSFFSYSSKSLFE